MAGELKRLEEDAHEKPGVLGFVTSEPKDLCALLQLVKEQHEVLVQMGNHSHCIVCTYPQKMSLIIDPDRGFHAPDCAYDKVMMRHKQMGGE